MLKCTTLVCTSIKALVKTNYRPEMRRALFVLITCALTDSSFGEELCGLSEPPAGTSTSCSVEHAEGDEDVNSSLLDERRSYSKLHYTSEYDWPLRHRLDYIEDILAGDTDEGVKLSEAILEEEPRSARANFLLTRGRDLLEREKDQSEEEGRVGRQEVMDRYISLVGWNESTSLRPIFNSAFQSGLEFAQSFNLTDKRIQLIEAYVSSDRGVKNDVAHLLLVHDLLLEARFSEALKRAEAAADRFYHQTYFKLLSALAMKFMGDKKAANKMLRELEFPSEAVYVIGPDVTTLAVHLIKRGRSDHADLIFKEASKLHIFPSRYQRPLEAFDDVEAKPIWSLEEDVGLTAHTDDLENLRSNFERIKDEALRVRQVNASLWLPHVSEFLSDVKRNDSWQEFPLYTFGRRRRHYCSAVPEVSNWLKEFKMATSCLKCTSKLVAFGPRTHILPICGPTNLRLRMHLPLKIPASGAARMRVGKDNIVEWRVGEPLVFDDSFEHEVWNESESEEVILLSVDLPHPDMMEQTTKFGDYAKALYALF